MSSMEPRLTVDLRDEPDIRPRPIAAKLAMLGIALYALAYLAMVITIGVRSI